MAGGRQAQRELRVLAFADLHLDRALPWTTRAVGAATRAGQQVAFEAICAIAATEADVLISAGDLYDFDRHHPDTGELLRAGFERLAPMPVVLVPGASDPLNGLSLYEQVKWSPNVHVLGTGRVGDLGAVEGLTVWAVREAAELGKIQPDPAAYNVAVLHGQAAPDDLPESGLDHVIAAAGHRADAGDRVTCPGAAYPVEPEDSHGGVVILTLLEDGSTAVTWREIGAEPPARPPRRFATDALADYELAAIGEEQTVRGEFVRNLLPPEETPVHLRRLALLSGLEALRGRPPRPEAEASK